MLAACERIHAPRRSLGCAETLDTPSATILRALCELCGDRFKRKLRRFQDNVAVLRRVAGADQADGVRDAFLELDVRLELDFHR